MKLEDLTTIDQLTEFLAGTQTVAFSVTRDKDASNLRLSQQNKNVVLTVPLRIAQTLIFLHGYIAFSWSSLEICNNCGIGHT